jgi:transporter family-2 protein
MLALILLAVAAGVAVAVQGQFMGMMNRTAGTATTMVITYGLGAIVAAGLWLFRRPPLTGVRQIPWYAWSAGLFGLVIVGGIGFAAPRLGLARTIVITIAAQLVAAMLIERSFDVSRAAGALLTIAGAWLIVKT